MDKATMLDIIKYVAKKYREAAEDARRTRGEKAFYMQIAEFDHEVMDIINCAVRNVGLTEEEYFQISNQTMEIMYGPREEVVCSQ